jgi:hypothetical protein
LSPYRAVCVEYETPSGNPGFAAFVPAIPGCVVRHASREKACRLVSEAARAISEDNLERALGHAPRFVYRFD